MAVISGVIATVALVVYQQNRVERGRELAEVYCGACHLVPEPDILPRRSWEPALGYMGYWLGIEDISYLSEHPEFAQSNVESRREALARDNLVPEEPLLSPGDWAALRSYYTEEAPNTSVPQQNKPRLNWTLPQLQVRPLAQSIPVSVITLVHIREDAGEIYIGDSKIIDTSVNSILILLYTKVSSQYGTNI